MKEITKSWAGVVARYILNFGSGILVAQGIMQRKTADVLVLQMAPGLAALLWAGWGKYKDRFYRLLALDMPAGSSERRLKAEAKSLPTGAVDVFHTKK